MRREPSNELNEGIELLYTRDCRAWPEALANLRQALGKLELKEEPRLVPVDTIDQARAYNFFASPTIHVNGIDIDPKARRISRRGLGSGRPYFFAGKASSVPPTELIVEGLQELFLT
jgi:hypothetical protein